METTKEERAREHEEALKVLAIHKGHFPPEVRARQEAHAGLVLRLCRDVDALEAALEETLIGFEALVKVAGPPRNNATAIQGYEDALRRIAKVRAVLICEPAQN
jgi:hypothetical protein